MNWVDTIIAAHQAVGSAVSHGSRLRSERYFVWQEDGENDLTGDDGHAEGCVTGVTDLYTKRELDQWADALGKSFDEYGISWELVLAEYEPETGFWHWSWDWEVV